MESTGRDVGATLPGLVARRAAESPGRTFVVDADSGASWTYGEVHGLAQQWAGALGLVGIGAGDMVLTMLSPRAEYLFAWLGLAWLKAADVPVNADFKGPVLSYLASNSSARVMLVEDTLLPAVLDVLPSLTNLEHILVLGYGDAAVGGAATVPITGIATLLARAEPADTNDPPRLHDVACVMYTSGTTGPSKGVLQPWGQLHQNVLSGWRVDDFGPEDTFYVTLPTHHQSARLVPYLAALQGGAFVFRPKFSATEFWPDVRKHGGTWSALIGVMAPFLVSLPPADDDADNPLRVVVMAPVLPDVDGFKARYGVEVTTCYGMTEIPAPVSSTGYEVTNDNAASCGRAVGGCEIRLVNELDYEVETGAVGELILRCDQPWTINLGYLGMPQATAEAWRNGWFHTGDGFRRDADGYYYFVDRMKDSIRRRGENISSMAVEALVNSHPDVAASAALGVPSEYSEDEIKVCVSLRPGAKLDPADLIAFLDELMPRFMVPRYVEFMDELPRTPTQRVRKSELRADPFNAATWDRETGRSPARPLT